MTHQSPEIGLIGGIEKRRIEIVDYDAHWPERFRRLASIMAEALGDAALRIEHIGSTAVPGLGAKPIIDILLVVADSRNEAAYLPKMEAIGYELRVREPDFHEHRMFRTPAKDVHVHVYSPASPEIERNLIFRDRLRQDAHDRQLYEDTKRKLATQSWPDMNAYAAAKTQIIERIIATARTATMRPTIRQALPADTENVSSILREAAQWLEQCGMAMWRDDELSPARIVADVDAGLFFVAECDGVAAGVVKFQLEDAAFWPDVPAGQSAFVHRLAVRRQFARGGVSSALLRWAVERTRSLGRDYLRLDCEASRTRLRAVYERFGFRHHSDRQVGPYFVSRYEYDVAGLSQ